MKVTYLICSGEKLVNTTGTMEEARMHAELDVHADAELRIENVSDVIGRVGVLTFDSIQQVWESFS